MKVALFIMAIEFIRIFHFSHVEDKVCEMKTLMVGNYSLSYKQSMYRYSNLLVQGLEMAGIDVLKRLWVA